MLAIKQFEQERRDWEQEKEDLESTSRWYAESSQKLQAEKEQVEAQRRDLASELERLRQDGCMSSRNVGPKLPGQTAQTHHKQQLALLSTIDSLKSSLREEQVKTTHLERRLSAPDSFRRGSGASLDVTVVCAGDKAGVEPEPERPSTVDTRPAVPAVLRAELLRNPRFSAFMAQLEDEHFKLREAVNAEKQRVLDLKRAEHNRKTAWREEMQNIQGELHRGQELERRLAEAEKRAAAAESRAAAAEARAAALEQAPRPQPQQPQSVNSAEADRLRQDLREAEAETAQLKAQLVRQAAQEVVSGAAPPGSARVSVSRWSSAAPPGAQNSDDSGSGGRPLGELVGLFLMHARDPLAAVARICESLVQADEMRVARARPAATLSQRCPPLLDQNGGPDGHVGQLTRVLSLLRFFAKVLETDWGMRLTGHLPVGSVKVG